MIRSFLILITGFVVAPTTTAWARQSGYRFMAIGDWGASYTPPKGRLKDTCEIDPSVNCTVGSCSCVELAANVALSAPALLSYSSPNLYAQTLQRPG